jgi:hypothetical protein
MFEQYYLKKIKSRDYYYQIVIQEVCNEFTITN